MRGAGCGHRGVVGALRRWKAHAVSARGRDPAVCLRLAILGEASPLKPFWLSLLSLGLWLLSGSATAEPVCADFLQALGQKPPGLEFIECSAGHDAQLRALIATYRVRGAQAEQVEHQLVRDAQLPPLRFACCGWHAFPRDDGQFRGSLPGPQERPYQVSMASEETLIRERNQWGAIPWFYVTLILDLEDP
ncbi:MAG: DUF4952 domain-containing protein [Pseudomonas sp.]|uniref:DUF4952 domain-containing protein n=1 Tax=Pseudomonas sp. TaxID=306 RepID=UPI00339945DF